MAVDVLLLLHAPPDVALARVEVCPTHALSVPVIEAGKELTVAIAVERQPESV